MFLHRERQGTAADTAGQGMVGGYGRRRSYGRIRKSAVWQEGEERERQGAAADQITVVERGYGSERSERAL